MTVPEAETQTDVVTRILRAAEQSISHFGLKRFTMGDVAKASGVRRQALYEHVGSRDDLVRAVLGVKARDLRNRAGAVIDRQPGLANKLVEGLLFIIGDSVAEPYMQGLVGEGEFGLLSQIVGADELMPKVTGEIWRPVLEAAQQRGELVGGHDYNDVERWLTYVTLMLVGSRAQGLSDERSERRLLAKMLLPALVS